MSETTAKLSFLDLTAGAQVTLLRIRDERTNHGSGNSAGCSSDPTSKIDLGHGVQRLRAAASA
jgi:hypothetical protein